MLLGVFADMAMRLEDYFNDVLSLKIDCSDLGSDSNDEQDHNCGNPDEDDEDDDGINVIIDTDAIKRKRTNDRSDELERIQTILNSAYIDDDEIQREIQTLVTKSLHAPVMSKYITVFVDNRFLVIDYDTPLTDRLKSYIWRPSKPFVRRSLPFIESMNKFIKPNLAMPDVYAVFSVKYERVNNLKRPISNQQPITTRPRPQKRNNALYIYTDFSILIVKNGKIVDYAIHGVHSSIQGAVEHWEPKQIFYNAEPNDPLDSFLHYKHQPFYGLIYKTGTPMKLYRNQQVICLALCERNDVYCAFCNGIKDLLGLTNFWHLSASNSQSNIITDDARLSLSRNYQHDRRFTRARRYDPYRQPYVNRRTLSVLRNT